MFLLCARPHCRSTPIRRRLRPTPNYFVASWARAAPAAEKLNAFSPGANYVALHKWTLAEPALFDTVIVQKYASTRWSA
jgi:hypothetical protein